MQPLAPIGAEAGPSEIGDVWHDALQKFAESLVVELSPDETRERLMAIARASFAPLLADPAFHALRWPRIVEGLDAFLAFDAARREGASAVWVEKAGRLEIPLSDGSRFTLTARADRIELLHGGGAAVIDYKTGVAARHRGSRRSASRRNSRSKRRWFRAAPSPKSRASRSSTAIYLKLGGADGGFVRELKFKDVDVRGSRREPFLPG